MSKVLNLGLAIFLAQVCCMTAGQEIELIGVGEIPGTATDKSGLEYELAPGIKHNLMGGISAMEYLGRDNLFVALPDRGPQDGAVDWR